MASGTITGSGSYVSLKINWSSTAGTGGSTVNANLIAVNQTYYYYYATVNNGYSLTINGTKKSGDTSKLSSTESGSSTLISNSVWVSYTGNKSITISGTADMSNITAAGNTIGTRSVSGTVALDKVGEKPPVPTVTAPTTSTISETDTSITITWDKSSDYSGKATYTLQVSKDGGDYSTVKSSIPNGTLEHAYTITAAQGKTYRFRVCAVNDIGSSSYSYSGTVTTNSLTAPTIGTLSTYNPYVTTALSVPLSGGSQANGNGFKRMAAVYYGSTKLATCTTPSNGNTTASITYSAANYATQIGTTAYSATFTVKAWSENSNGSKSSTVSKNFTVNLNSDGKAAPTLNNPTLSGGFTGYTSTCFIVGKHSLTVTSGSASTNRAPSGTTLSYKISCTGFSDVASNSATFTTPTAGKKTITVTVTDSRGLSASKTVYCRFQSWTKPTIKITKAERNATTTSTINVTYTVSYSAIYNTYGADGDTAGTDINGINSQQYSVGGSYANCTSPLSITNASTDAGYTITIRAADKIETSTYGTASKFVGTVDRYIAMRNKSIGVGCIPDSTYRLDVKGLARIYDSSGNVVFKNGSIYPSGNLYLPNSKYIYSYRSDGTAHTLLAIGDTNNVAFNYSGYNNEIGSTNLYGNNINLYSKNTIIANKAIQVSTNGSIFGPFRIGTTAINIYPSYTDAVDNTNRHGWFGFGSSSGTMMQFINLKGASFGLKGYDSDGNVAAGVNISTTALYPDADNARACGSSSYKWSTIYATNGTINTSDRTHKKNIKELDDKYIQLFNKLIPVSFEFNYATSDRTHIGFISQDVEEAMSELGISDLEFAGFCKDIKQVYNEDTDEWNDVLDEDGNPIYIYSLRYQEFIALNTYMIQKCMDRINQLEKQL